MRYGSQIQAELLSVDAIVNSTHLVFITSRLTRPTPFPRSGTHSSLQNVMVFFPIRCISLVIHGLVRAQALRIPNGGGAELGTSLTAFQPATRSPYLPGATQSDLWVTRLHAIDSSLFERKSNLPIAISGDPIYTAIGSSVGLVTGGAMPRQWQNGKGGDMPMLCRRV
jgi:hypothetical protein